MSAISDRQTLITEFEAYQKRVFLTDRQDVFIQLTEDRVFRDTRAQENLAETTLVPVTTLIDLPDDFIDLRELSFMNGSRRIVLTSVGRHMFARFASRTGRQSVYSIMGGDPKQVEVAPTTLPDQFTLWYWQKSPALVAPTDTNILLTSFPYLWLYGMLIEGNVFIQDDVGRQRAQEFYTTELTRVNAQADASRFGEAPVLGAG